MACFTFCGKMTGLGVRRSHLETVRYKHLKCTSVVDRY